MLTIVVDAPIHDSVNGEEVNCELGAIDQLTVGAIRKCLDSPGSNLIVEIFRGEHDVSTLIAVAVRLIQLVSTEVHQAAPLCGPVVSVSGRVALLERLKDVRVRNVLLADALSPRAVRRDGQLRGADGEVIPECEQGLLHMSNRIGWPNIDLSGGCVVVDGTSMRPSAVDTAIKWATENNVRNVIVVADLGSEIGDTLTKHGDNYLRVAWTPTLIHDAVEHLGTAGDPCPLSTNGLLNLGRTCDLEIVEVSDPEAASLLQRSIRRLISVLRDGPREPLPEPLASTRQLLNGCCRLCSTAASFDRRATIHPMSVPLASLAIDVRNGRGREFLGAWRSIGETRWASLKDTALRAWEAVASRSSRLEAVEYAIDRAASSGCLVVVRAPSAIAANALAEDLNSRGRPVDGSRLRVIASADRLPWDTNGEIVEVIASPDLWHVSGLLSAEASMGRWAVAWPHETARIEWLLADRCAQLDDSNRRTFESMDLGEYPEGPAPVVNAALSAPSLIADGGEEESPALPAIDLDILTDPLNEEGGVSSPVDGLRIYSSGPVRVVPVVLSPAQLWYADVDMVSVFRSESYRTLPIGQLAAHDVVLVPAPGVHGDLFLRLLAARHKQRDVASLDIIMRTWRRALEAAVLACGGNIAELHRRLEECGVSITYAAVRFWVEGVTLAPATIEDIRAVGYIADDDFVFDQAPRIAAVAGEIRVDHRRLGRILARALSEATTGHSSHLRMLADFVDDLQIAEILDEFEQREVVDVHPEIEVDPELAGRIVELPNGFT